jgi:hypothetical protein
MLNIVRAGQPQSPVQASSDLTAELWGLHWNDILPLSVAGTSVHAVGYDTAAEFMRDHYGQIFDLVPNSPFARNDSCTAKTRYYRHTADCFAFYDGSEAVALVLANAVDWSTYYIRSAASLPSHQGRLMIPRFLPVMFDTLRAAGVERVEAEASPTNMTSLQLLMRLGFKVTGTVTTDRWGSLVRLTKFLCQEAEQVFVDQFCAVVSGRKAR